MKLLSLSASHIRFIWPTYLATQECMTIATQEFGRKHYRNGQSNAFRHALWNILIAQKCAAIVNLEKSLKWTKRITDWHEEAFYSNELAKLMDLHNNEVGRRFYKENTSWSKTQFIELLLKHTSQSQQISTASNLDQFHNRLIHISDDYA